MSDKYDALIIGTGIGGSAVGALLASAGWNILILDKNPIPGGRCTSYEKDGFTVDLGVHLFGLGNRGSLGEVCRRASVPGAIDWVTISIQSLWIDHEVKKYSRKNMTERLSAEEKVNLEKLFLEASGISDPELEKLWYVPLSEWVGRFTRDPVAQAFIERINSQYFCVKGLNTSTTEFIRCYREVTTTRSSAYPRGGCISIPKAYLSAIQKYGGEVRLRAKVVKILVDRGAAAGVRLADGTELRAPVIIANGDIKHTVLGLAGREHFPEDYVARVEGLSYAYHAVGLKMALEEKITDDQLMMYMPYDLQASLKIEAEKMEGKLPDRVRGMITSPTNYDPSLAPEGKQLIFFGTGCPPHQDWEKWEKVILDSLFTVYPEAIGKVLWYRLDTPDLVNVYAGETGNVIGVAQTVNQVHHRRPSVVTPLRGLCLSSAEAGGHGIGAELAASSALELFEILKL
jgi:phytoene dehydrogenase-like protein